MEPEMLRAIERIVIILFAGVSIILGWHLFKIGVVSTQKGELSGKGVSIKLLKVGPGVFFSLFGSIVLSISLHNSLNINKTIKKNNGVIEKTEYRYLNLKNDDRVRDLVRSINTLDYIDLEKSSIYESYRGGITIAIENLNNYRDYLARKKFSNEIITEYLICSEKGEDHQCKRADSYKEISKWLTETIL